MVLGSWRVNFIWKIVWNDSGAILELLEIDTEHASNVKVHMLTISPTINSQNNYNSKFISRFQHLVTNVDQGPHLKFAPGHESMEDSDIIRNCLLKSGSVDLEKNAICFFQLLGNGRLRISFGVFLLL